MESEDFPQLFELCRKFDEALYHRNLRDQFSAPKLEPLYLQFMEKLRLQNPVQVVTTNVDLCLEQNLGQIPVIERSDLELLGNSISSRRAFIAKLHGSISSINSTVFATSDYESIQSNEIYIAAVSTLFSAASVVFLGYGAKDDYVLKLLARDHLIHNLFGGGPHFLVTDKPGPPEKDLYRIGYSILQHPDHRAALSVLTFLHQSRTSPIVEASRQADAVEASSVAAAGTGFFISTFYPSGTHVSSQTVNLKKIDEGGMEIKGTLGLGFQQGELRSSEPVAFHDLCVGLVCFDRIYLPLSALVVLHERATSEVFWALIDSGALSFIDIVHEPFFVSTPDSVTGNVGVARIQDPHTSETRTSMSVVRKMLKPAPGNEEIGEQKINSLQNRVTTFEDSEKLNLGAMVRSALLLPKVSQLLGFSDYTQPNAIPSWLAYPTLRLAHLVQSGLICNRLLLRASRVPFGGVTLLSAAFGVMPPDETVYEYASFVLTGAFGSNLSALIEHNPKLILQLLKFRETQEAIALRKEIGARLKTNDGNEFSAAIEGALKKTLGASILQAARNRASEFMKAPHEKASVSAIWTDSQMLDILLCCHSLYYFAATRYAAFLPSLILKSCQSL
ncbi:MAG: SIR2 family NAD-dependent protein deacylase [Acidobacteriota bacterium]